MPTAKPLLFLSHKHTDRKIASVIREFVFQATNRDVDVYQSSSVDSESPRLGRHLTDELRDALWRTGVVILVYTTEDQDWHYCMWECGVAMTPNSPDTNIIVLQCSTKAPSVFQGDRRVNARSREDVHQLVKTLLTQDAFFPGYPAVAKNLHTEGPEVKKRGDELFEALAAVLPKSNAEESSVQPSLTLELSFDAQSRFSEASSEVLTSAELAKELSVSQLDAQAGQILGVAGVSSDTKLAQLGDRWRAAGDGRSTGWVDDMAEQVLGVIRNNLPALGWGLLEDGQARYVPVVTRTRRLPAQSLRTFDVNLLRFDEFAATRAVSRMIPFEQLAYHRIDLLPPEQIKVKELLERFRRDGHSRLPFLTSDKRVKMVVHRSTVANYIADKVTSGEPVDVANLSLRDLIEEDANAKNLFAGFATVGPSARLREVSAAMGRKREIQDVFVTTTGKADDPILGWITNAMLAEQL